MSQYVGRVLGGNLESPFVVPALLTHLPSQGALSDDFAQGALWNNVFMVQGSLLQSLADCLLTLLVLFSSCLGSWHGCGGEMIDQKLTPWRVILKKAGFACARTSIALSHVSQTLIAEVWNSFGCE